MMAGGGILMLILGLLFMLLVIGLPILLIVALLGGAARLLRNQNIPATPRQTSLSAVNNPDVQPGQPVAAPARFCAHCSAGLHTDWTHCPQCGAPIHG